MKRGEIWWASVPAPIGSGPGHRRPVLVVQSNPFNGSLISTVIVAVVTSNLRLADAPGNVRLSKGDSRLAKASVVNVSQVITVDRALLTQRVHAIPSALLQLVDEGLRLVLAL